MARNIVKTLQKDFADMKVGQKMPISSPEDISKYILKDTRWIDYHAEIDAVCPCLRKRR